MQYAINTPNFGPFAQPRLLADLAREAEDAGWDAFFVWDHVQSGQVEDAGDPWIQLAAIAMATERVRIGTMVTPVARRRPWKLARETVSLDHLSNGRMVLGIGLGHDVRREYSTFGESTDDLLHRGMLDEGMDVIAGLWSGEPFSYEGEHFQIHDAQFLPKPVQNPRIPVWVAGRWPTKRPFRRAARWDGVFPQGLGGKPLTPDDIRDLRAYILAHRKSSEPFVTSVAGRTTGSDRDADRARVEPFIEAGADWWHEGLAGAESVDAARERIRRGAPRV